MYEDTYVLIYKRKRKKGEHRFIPLNIVSSPAVLDFGCQVDIRGPPSFSVFTSTTDPMLVPTSVDVDASMDRDRVQRVVVLQDSACNTDPLPSLPGNEDTVEEEDM